MARQIGGTARRAPLIELSALFGTFRVPGSDFTIRFASTFANTETPGHRELLSQLKPMRDRVEASGLTDLTALLQRDLNDRRVARDLIPYLLGTNSAAQSKVGFFPAVLAVLIPTGYLRQGADADTAVPYPAPFDDEDGLTDFRQADQRDFAWQVEHYTVGSERQPVGLIRINPRHSEIVVLDGQHRSNAFRYLAGDFDPNDDVYGEFYRGIERPSAFEADLPVTMIWFEAPDQTEIKPRLISRQLFVDVNNSAHAVSLARTILLDDRSVSAVATQAFYNRAAEEGFKAGSFSLLHAAFDMDSDLADAALPLFALTSPEIVENAFLWLLLGSTRYNAVSYWRVDRMRAQRNRNQFAQIVGRLDHVLFGTDDDDNAVVLDSPERAEEYRRTMRDRVTPALWLLMSGLTFLEAHYRAAVEVETWVQNEADTTTVLAWNKIFVGGEGLYWTFKDKVDSRNQYALATAQIERRFREERGRNLSVDPGVSDAVFKSFSTKAFQVGFVMAASFLAERGRGGGDLVEATEDLVANLNRFSPQNWIAFFRELRPLALKGDAAPKTWPTYRNLILRLYDEGHLNLFDTYEDTPEFYIYRGLLTKLGARLRTDHDELPVDIDRQVLAERDRLVDVLRRTGLTSEWLSSEGALTRGRAILAGAFEGE